MNVNNATTKNSLKQTKQQTKSQFVYKILGHVTEAAGIEVKDRSQKSGSIQERSVTKLAPCVRACGEILLCLATFVIKVIMSINKQYT